MRKVLVVFFLALSVVACTSPPPPPAPVPVPEPVVVPVVEPPVVEAPVVEPAPLPTEPQEFQVSVEKKQTSLAEIRVLVDKLNALIEKKAFGEWKSYLDQDYIQTYSSARKLSDVSARDPLLVQLKKKLKTLEDYFTWEVVPSRVKATVDDITFLDEDRVYVWTVVDNERFLLYLLKLYGKEWKISSW